MCNPAALSVAFATTTAFQHYMAASLVYRCMKRECVRTAQACCLQEQLTDLPKLALPTVRPCQDPGTSRHGGELAPNNREKMHSVFSHALALRCIPFGPRVIYCEYDTAPAMRYRVFFAAAANCNS